MSYTVVSPGGKARPGTVTAASALLFVGAAIELASVVLTVMTLGPIQSVLDEFSDGSEAADTVATVTSAGAIGGAVFAGLFGVALIVLGFLIRKGKNPARIVTWVLGGIGVLCNGCSLGGTALSSSLGGSSADPNAEELQRRLTEVIPSWQASVAVIATVLYMVCLLAAIILLALPASNAFYRKEQEVWVPPTAPGGGSGGFPPAPPAPSAPDPFTGPPAGPPATPQG